MIALVFGFVTLVMIGAGVLISRLAEIAKTGQRQKDVDLGDSYTHRAHCGAAAFVGRHRQVRAIFIGGRCF